MAGDVVHDSPGLLAVGSCWTFVRFDRRQAGIDAPQDTPAIQGFSRIAGLNKRAIPLFRFSQS